MDDTRFPNKLMEWKPYRRKRDKPRKTWKEGIEKTLSARDRLWEDRKGWGMAIGFKSDFVK